MTKEQRLLILQAYHTMKDEIDYIEGDFLMDICEQWIVRDSKLSFEDFMDGYLESDYE